MFRFVGKVQYVDGRIEEFTTGNAALAAWESYAARHKLEQGLEANQTTSALCIAHHGLGIEQGFDAWRATVDGVELDAEDVEAVDPTRPVASTG